MEGYPFLITALAVIFVGVSKAGFGGGAGLLATPLIAMVMPAREAVGVLLPLLIVSDLVAMWHYRHAWDPRPLRFLAVGLIAGILVGTAMLGRVDDVWLKRVLGAICLIFCAVQWGRTYVLKWEEGYQPGWISGTLFGFGVGTTSALAHAAGPVMAMYLLPQQMAPALYMATNVVAFGMINLLKLPPYLLGGLINGHTLTFTLWMTPFILVGTGIGLWCNRHVSPIWFSRIVYSVLFLSGWQLLLTH
jgi:uncharacterized membrane protein YfcA